MRKHPGKALTNMVLSCVLCSIAVNWVALPNGFVVTGITGLSMAAAQFTGVNYALIYYGLALAILLCTALTGAVPVSHGQRLHSLLLTLGYLVLTLIPPSRVRAVGLLLGMGYCLGILMAMYARGSDAALLMLFPCAITIGFRVWVVLPGMHMPFFQESVFFYLFRCARIYDAPFTLGCMAYVCRRYALQFDRAEQLARELDARVIQRTKALTEETEARKSMMLNIFHDLRSPLFAVSSGLDTLEAAPEALPALLPALQQRTAFLRRLTEDLFLAAKLEQSYSRYSFTLESAGEKVGSLGCRRGTRLSGE